LLQEELRPVIQRYEELKSQSGCLDFLDLLLRARDLVCCNRAVREQLQQRFTHILVDEFQDTDPVQCEIFERLYAPDRHEPGSLLLVGDPKQAIYAFRGADVFAYLKAASTAARVSLPVNYRSDPGLLRALNAFWLRAERPFAQVVRR